MGRGNNTNPADTYLTKNWASFCVETVKLINCREKKRESAVNFCKDVHKQSQIRFKAQRLRQHAQGESWSLYVCVFM